MPAMNLVPRTLEKIIKNSAKKYPAVTLMGPRQSGKTTLARLAFPHLPYVSLENPDARTFAIEDPNRFLGQYPHGAILDEIQRTPALFSYIQTLVDEKTWDGLFVLTGSHNFLLMETVSQSLAGRISIHKLLPLSLNELSKTLKILPSLNTLIYTGGYPRIHDKKLVPTEWFENYVETYLERDVRLLKNVGDLSTFHLFLRMCANRAGQLLNLSSLANDCGITHNTAKAWLSILEASFLILLLLPHHKNFNKRLKKSPKLYFYDCGLLCYLLGITKSKELETHNMRGAIFENLIISELHKQRLHKHLPLNLYFWQDKLGREIDCVIEQGERLIPIEIKAGKTIAGDFFKNLSYWNRLSRTAPQHAYLIYAGKEYQKRAYAQVLGWNQIDNLPL